MSSPLIWFGNAAKFLKSSLVIPGSTSGTITITAPATPTSYAVTLPSAQGGTSTFLQNNGAGTLTWATAGGGGSTGNLIEQFYNTISGMTAGEAITANDAVCLSLNQGVYKVFRCNSSLGSRSTNFIGFATASGTVTPQIVTIGISPAAWTSGSASITINGRSYTQAFITSHNASVAALAAQLAADPEMASAVASGSPSNLLTLTSAGGLTIVVAVVQQPTGATFGTPSTTQSPAGSNIDIQMFGVMSGFTGLTTGLSYYVGSSNGAITSVPTGSTIFTGQALSSTVMFVNPQRFQYLLGGSEAYYRTHGTSSGVSNAGTATQDGEMFDFAAWTSIVASTLGARYTLGNGDGSFSQKKYVVDGQISGGTPSALTSIFNKTSWSAGTTRSSNSYYATTMAGFGYLHVYGGLTSTSSGSVTANGTKFDGSSWTNGTGLTANKQQCGSFLLSSLLYVCGGYTTGAAVASSVDTFNSADVLVVGTSQPAGQGNQGFSSNGSGLGLVGSDTTTNVYAWNGSAWSAQATTSVTLTYASAAYASTRSLQVINGSGTGSTIANLTNINNGTSYTSGTSSITSRGYASAAAL